MKPLRVPGDGAKAARTYLAGVVPALVDAPAPTFGLNLPPEWRTTSAPHVAVFDDPGPTYWPAATKPRIRVAVWADGRDRVRSIAGICMGVLLAHRIPGLATVTDPTDLQVDRDDKNGAIIAGFTVAALVRTLPL